MEPYLNSLGLPETYGGFGPDRHWRGLNLVPDLAEPKAGAVSSCTEAGNCRPVETCC